MTRAYFVTGTDTGVGKTTVTAALAARLVEDGQRVAVFKPLESGCERTADGLRAADAEALRLAAGATQSAAETCIYRFATPVAPAVAARREGIEARVEALDAGLARLRDGDPEWLFVEGAGGLLVPAIGDMLMADLAGRWRLPLLIVGRDGLGTINHTMLTIEVARRRGLVVGGFVLSAISAEPPTEAQENATEIERLSGAPYLGRLDWLVPGNRAAVPGNRPAVAAGAIDLARLG